VVTGIFNLKTESLMILNYRDREGGGGGGADNSTLKVPLHDGISKGEEQP